jgi:DHA1 family bicyclomycin/chloramphenicol resistance-like MFS transporter
MLVNIVGIFICILAAYIHSYEWLLFGRLVTALGAAAGLCCTFMLINVLLEEKEAKEAFSLSVLSFTLGIGLAVLLGSLITEYGDWRQCFGLLLLVGVIMLVSTRLFEDKAFIPQKINIQTIWHNYRCALENKNLLMYGIILGSCPVSAYLYSAAAPFICTQNLGLTPSGYGYWNSLTMVGMLLGGVGSMWAIKRFTMEAILKVALCSLSLSIVSLWLMAYLKIDSALWFFLVRL